MKNILPIVFLLLMPFVFADPPVEDVNYSWTDFQDMNLHKLNIKAFFLTPATTMYSYNFPVKSLDLIVNYNYAEPLDSTFMFTKRKTGTLTVTKTKWKECMVSTGTTDCQRDFKVDAADFLIKNNKKVLSKMLRVQNMFKAFSEDAPSLD